MRLNCIFILFQLVNNFQTEASLRKQEAEAAASKLSSVRKMIAKLLTSSNEVSWAEKLNFISESEENQLHTVKFLNFGTPENFAVIT